jgi:hypothetical protein
LVTVVLVAVTGDEGQGGDKGVCGENEFLEEFITIFLLY